MDKELKSLMDRLKSVSSMDARQGLNDRNVIDIFQQLLARDLLRGVFTTDGKEFVTRDEILRSISDELEVHGGRLNVMDLPQLTGVDMCHIEGVMPKFLSEAKASGDEVTTMGGELFTELYFSGVVEEVVQRLGPEPRIIIAEIARRLQLPTQFLTALLAKTIPATTAVIDDNVLMAATFMAQQRAVVRGAVRGALLPLAITALADRVGIASSAVLRIVEGLIAANDVDGELYGGARGSFIPLTYVRARDAMVAEFYTRNGFVEFTYLRAAGVSEGAAYMTQRYGLSVVPKAAAPVSGGAGGKGKRAAKAAAVAPVATATPCGPLSGLALAGCFLSDQQLLLCCVPPLEELGAPEGVQAVALAAYLPPCVDTTVDDDVILQRLSLECGATLSACEVLPGLRFVHSGAVDQIVAHVKGMAHAEDVRGARKLALISGKILRVELDGGDGEALVTDLVARIGPTLDALYDAARNATAINETQRAKLQRAELDRLARTQWSGVHIVARGLAFVAAAPDLAAHAPTMQKAAVGTLVTRVVRMILLDTLWAMEASNVNTFPMLASEAEDAVALPIKKLREALPKVSTSADNAILATKCATVAEAVTHLEKMSNNAEMGLVLRPLGRKDDKESVAAMADALRVEVSAAAPATVEDLAAALVRLTALAFYKAHKVVVIIPGKSVAAFAAYLKDPALTQLQAAVTVLLSGGAKVHDVRAAAAMYDAVRTAVLLESKE